MGNALLLHYLDRELRESVKFNLSDLDCKKITMYSLFMSNIVYAVITHGIENSIELPETTCFLNRLNSLGFIEYLSKVSSLEELIVNRQRLYAYDRSRYPFYFQDNFKIHFPDYIITVEGSTTDFIKDSLEKIYIRQGRRKEIASENTILENIVVRRLKNFDGQGLTINSFNPIFKKIRTKSRNKYEIDAVRSLLNQRLISLYNTRYLKLSKAHIIKSIPRIQVYDFIDDGGFFDLKIYHTILSPLFTAHGGISFEDTLLEWRSQYIFSEIVEFLDEIVESLFSFFPSDGDIQYHYSKQRIISLLSRCIYEMGSENICYSKPEGFCDYLERLKRKIGILGEFNKSKGKEKKMYRILLPVATDIEFEVILEVAKAFKFELQRKVIGQNTYHIFETDMYSAYIVRCEQGSMGAGSSILTLADSIKNIGIDTIVFGGIAFGNYQKKKEKIGDILVSKQIWNYEPGKMSDRYISRGDKVTASPWMLDRFHNSKQDWKGEIHFGLIASGEKLLNQKEIIDEILAEEPEIIGGDMEGSGMVAVAERYRLDWILVKAISDWGFDKSDNGQRMAAQNAFQYIFLTLTKYMF